MEKRGSSNETLDKEEACGRIRKDRKIGIEMQRRGTKSWSSPGNTGDQLFVEGRDSFCCQEFNSRVQRQSKFLKDGGCTVVGSLMLRGETDPRFFEGQKRGRSLVIGPAHPFTLSFVPLVPVMISERSRKIVRWDWRFFSRSPSIQPVYIYT